MFAESVDVVIGVDTHRDSHALALVDAGLGALIAEERVDANRAGYRRALKLASGCGRRRLWAVEGSGSYGAGLARYLQHQGERVLELERPVRSGSRGRAKSDALDALRAARAALTGEPLAELRSGGRREALRVLLVSREASVAVRRRGLNQLRALVLTAPAELRERLLGLPKGELVKRCIALRPRPGQQPQLRGTLLALRSCGRQVKSADRATRLQQRYGSGTSAEAAAQNAQRRYEVEQDPPLCRLEESLRATTLAWARGPLPRRSDARLPLVRE